MRTGERREPRISFVVPVTVWTTDTQGMAALCHACVLDASWSGVRLYTYALTRTGEVVTLGYQHRKASFRVVWIAPKGTARQGQAGLERLDERRFLFRHLQPVPGRERSRGPSAASGMAPPDHHARLPVGELPNPPLQRI